MRSFIALEQAGIDDVYAVTNSALAPAFTNIGVPVICVRPLTKGRSLPFNTRWKKEVL